MLVFIFIVKRTLLSILLLNSCFISINLRSISIASAASLTTFIAFNLVKDSLVLRLNK
jgi:hypothetical protein